MARRSRIWIGSIVAALVGTAGCGNEAPLFPTYSHDIKPLMEGRCVRCHGAGGSLNTDPAIKSVSGLGTKPSKSDFSQLASTMDRTGLLGYTVNAQPTEPGIVGMLAFLPKMPPAPADGLSSFDSEMLLTWCRNPLP